MPQQYKKLLIELGPLVIFFATNYFGGIFWATGVFMAATAVSLLLSWAIYKHIPPMLLVGAAFVAVFGGLTLYYQDSIFFKLKVTLVNLLFGVMLLGGLAFGRLFLKMVMGEQMKMEDAGWRKLTIRTGVFFFALAALNEFIWRTQSEGVWVAFKSFGILPLTLVFFAAQTPLMMRHMIEDKPDPPAS